MKRRTFVASLGGILAVSSGAAVGQTALRESVTTESNFRVLGSVFPPEIVTFDVTSRGNRNNAQFNVFLEAEASDAELDFLEFELYNESDGGELVDEQDEDIEGESFTLDNTNYLRDNNAGGDTFTTRAILTDVDGFRDIVEVTNET